MTGIRVTVHLCVSALFACALAAAADVEAVKHTESWPNNDAAFAKFEKRIEAMHGRNLLARKECRLVDKGGLGGHATDFLADGLAGERCGEGRAAVSGNPSVITFHLGEPKTITEVGVFHFNGDARANQDYEVRFFNNSKSPGKKPKFRDKPDLTTGPEIIGKNGGGFHSCFRAKDGGELVPGKADWVQLRIWRTYNVKVGAPAKNGNTASSWTSVIEIEVLGDEKDVVALSKEEIERRKAFRRAPKKPKYEKKATWQETMVAAREAVVEWECMQDRLALPESKIVFGPWYTLGPLPKGSEAVTKIETQRKIDFKKRYEGKDGKPIGWERRPDLKDGSTIELTKHFETDEGDVVFLCRAVEVNQKFDRKNPFSVSLGMRSWWVKLLPKNTRKWAPKDAQDIFPNQVVWKWQLKPSKCQLLAKLGYAKNGPGALWFLPQPPRGRPGAGALKTRVRRREQIFTRLRRDFPKPVDTIQMTWEQLDSIWIKSQRRAMARKDKSLTDWAPGNPDFLNDQYADQIDRRAAELERQLAKDGAKQHVVDWIASQKAKGTDRDVAKRRAAYYSLAALKAALAELHRIDSMRLAVRDQQYTFEDRYPNAEKRLARVAELQRRGDTVLARVIERGGVALAGVLELRSEIDRVSREVLLANPLLKFDKLLVATGGKRFASNWSGSNKIGNAISVLSPARPDGKLTTIHRGNVGSMELSFDAKRILFSDGKGIFEIDVDGTGLRRISPKGSKLLYYDPCRLPNGKIIFVSNACEQAVPCTGQPNVGNLHIMDDDGGNERRLTFDQDHDWNPIVMHDGRVLFSRWEYNDTPHYFTRLLFHMYPDGSGQMEYYGSNSYWPNSTYWPQPIPGHPTMICCIVSGHHGVSREGEMLLLDPNRGRHEADGVVQRIPGRGRHVEPVIKDGLVGDSWPRFACPWPLAEPGTHLGAGEYFLVSCKMSSLSPWGLYLVDVFDNMTPILMGNYFSPIPLRPRPTPPVIQDRIDLRKKDAVVYMTNVYEGGGLEGYPRGSITALRLSSVHYRYPGNGDTRAASYDGGWDVKRILGTVPVREDGSAIFRVPANTPIVVQPLDAEGRAQQQMRSWFAAMPGEKVSCVGCHERQNVVTPNQLGLSMRHEPSRIKPWYGPTRGFSFDREVQPVLDRRCAGCHNGQPRKDGRTIPDFRAKRLHKKHKGNYSPAYLALHPYVRRAGYEADYHMLPPAEFEADTSQLVQMLKKGHHNVRLTREEWDRIYTWIDLNIPYPVNWRESHRPPKDDQVARRAKYKKLHAYIDDRDEDPLPLPPVAKFEPPRPEIRNPKSETQNLPGWPFDAEEAAKRQEHSGLAKKTVDLGRGVTMTLVPIPAGQFVMGDAKGFPDERTQSVVRIQQPFLMGQFEVTNEQYAQFDPQHDSGYMDGRGKDRFTRGTPVNKSDQPVVRVTWREAMAFCEWLSRKTGIRCALPTEAQWEWACRAGTATPFHFGEAKAGLKNAGNFSDAKLKRWNWGRIEAGYADGAMFSVPGGKYEPNAWGLRDMHGNVAEWCLSRYAPYPYDPTDGRNGPEAAGLRVVRGGSWNDRFKFSRSASRWRYAPYKPVYNVGVRVVCYPWR